MGAALGRAIETLARTATTTTTTTLQSGAMNWN